MLFFEAYLGMDELQTERYRPAALGELADEPRKVNSPSWIRCKSQTSCSPRSTLAVTATLQA